MGYRFDWRIDAVPQFPCVTIAKNRVGTSLAWSVFCPFQGACKSASFPPRHDSARRSAPRRRAVRVAGVVFSSYRPPRLGIGQSVQRGSECTSYVGGPMPVQTAAGCLEGRAAIGSECRPHLAHGRRLQHSVRTSRGRLSEPRTSRFGVGSRVCLAPGRRHPDFLPGEPGVVTLALHPSTRGVPVYTVRRTCDGRVATCYEDELIPC